MFSSLIYDKLYPVPVKHQFVLRHLRGMTVTDIGGGTGLRASLLEKEGLVCRNIEPQKDLRLISLMRGVETYGKNYGMTDNVLIMFHVINFFDNVEEEFEEAVKYLRKGGKLIFDYWNYDVRREGFNIDWKGWLTRITYKKWKGDNVTVIFFFPFMLSVEKHKLKVYSDKFIKKLLKGFKILVEVKTSHDTVVSAIKL